MFTCEVSTTYTDPLKVHDEIAKHAEAAKAKFGECWMSGTQNTSIPDHDAGVPTGTHSYRLTTYWQQGIQPGSEPVEPLHPPAPRREGE